MWRIFGGATLVVAGIAAFIEASSLEGTATIKKLLGYGGLLAGGAGLGIYLSGRGSSDVSGSNGNGCK